MNELNSDYAAGTAARYVIDNIAPKQSDNQQYFGFENPALSL